LEAAAGNPITRVAPHALAFPACPAQTIRQGPARATRH
jgi:hypothetical protein